MDSAKMNRNTYRKQTERNREAHIVYQNPAVIDMVIEYCDMENMRRMLFALRDYFRGAASREELAATIQDPVARMAFLFQCGEVDEDDRMRDLMGDAFDPWYKMIDEEARQGRSWS